MIADLRQWRVADGDWRRTLARIQNRYGYDRYGGNVHIVPNHALIHLGLLYGDDDFGRSLMITNTAGWDTDCNSGNVGCLLGLKHGLAAFEGGKDWRGPVADRMFISSADGGRGVTDAATETGHLVATARALRALAPEPPNGGIRFHFSYPGSVQGRHSAAWPAAQRAWESALDHFQAGWECLYHAVQNQGRGMAITGQRTKPTERCATSAFR